MGRAEGTFPLGAESKGHKTAPTKMLLTKKHKSEYDKV